MRRTISAASIAATLAAGLSPAMAQTAAEQARWEEALKRYQNETRLYYEEWDRYQAARRGRGGDDGGQQLSPPDDRYTPPPSSYETLPPVGEDAPPISASPEPGLPPADPPVEDGPGIEAPPVPLPTPLDPPEAPTAPALPQADAAPAPPAAPDIVPVERDDRFDPGYDAAKFYREAPEYRERVLAASDRVYRGSDNRFYCQRSDGTTGLIAGGGQAFAGLIDGGHSRTVGTLLGATSGGLAGDDADRQPREIRCR